MPHQATEKSSTATIPFWFGATMDGALRSMMKGFQAAFESGFKEYSEETLAFLTKRLEHNSEAIEECRTCKDVGGLVGAQQKWLMELAHDYLDEAVRINDVARKMLASGLGTAGNGARQPST